MSARIRRLCAATGLGLALALAGGLGSTVARADVFGSLSMLSASPFGQAEFARDPAIAEDGRYVVFDGSVAGVTGVWRRETRPGALFEQVAGGDATLPSVSADGRYVSFTTNEGASLPAITDGQIHSGTPVREAPGVYVRDMSVGAAEPGAFTIASAKDHSTQSLAYEFPGASEGQLQTDIPQWGATATGRSAISADGRDVAFVTTAWSDLAGPHTPPLQVAVRHLDTEETQLVSVRFDPATGKAAVDPETAAPEPVPEQEERYGAVYTKNVPQPFTTENGVVTGRYQVGRLLGASISADGSAVAWMGEQISEQARTLSGETLGQTYAEPLWHRITGGPLEPTRRVTGGSDPEAPGCRAAPEPRLPAAPVPGDPCQGPFATQSTGATGLWNNNQEADFVPRLSADGNDVAFIVTGPLVADAGGFGIGGDAFNSDVFWADMTAPDRSSALRQVTQFASGEPLRIPTNANISDLAISPDGTQVAFTTRRTVFPLGVPAYISPPASVPGLGELFDADLSDNTLTRVTVGYEGGTPEHPEPEAGREDRYEHISDGALSPSFTAGGSAIAFSSTASNLVYGDGNTPPSGSTPEFDGADVFLAPRTVFEPDPTPQAISPAPANPKPEVPWRLSVAAASLRNGTVRIRAELPAAGRFATAASSALPAGAARRSHRRVLRTVARASAQAEPDATGTFTIELKLAGPYRKLADRAGGLPCLVRVSFAAPGHPALYARLSIRFRRVSAAPRRRGR